MRMDKSRTITARHIVNGYEENELSRILWEYGEEKWAARIAKFIVEEREKEFIETTGQLVSIIKRQYPSKSGKTGPIPQRKHFRQ